MARIARLVIPGAPHHVTQRGNNRKQIFFSNQDYLLYLLLLKDYAARYQLSLMGYCLMPNHVHLIAIPHEADSLARTLGRTHADYARAANIQARTTGHFWQSRFYSCPMDERHQWFALAYVERNPLRAGLVADPARYLWSSAPARFGGPDASTILDQSLWQTCYDQDAWRAILTALSRDEALDKRIRDSTRTGRPLGDESFLAQLESTYPHIRPNKRGPKPKPATRTATAQGVK
jgi:putative transposase